MAQDQDQDQAQAPADAPAAAPAATPAAVPAAVADFNEKSGVLVSRVAYPITVEYGDGHLRVSPRGKTNTLLRRLLPARLPAGLTFVDR